MKAKEQVERTRGVLSAFPVRRPVKWRLEKERAVIIYRKDLNKLEKRLRRLLGGPENIRRPLDAIGTDVWLMCDGANTVMDIVGAIDAKYKEEAEPVEKRVCGLLELLLKAGLIELRSGSGGLEEKGKRPSATRSDR